jgi:hypothetical protein
MATECIQKDFFELRGGEMGFHLEISEIRLAQKANGRVPHLKFREPSVGRF